MRKIIVFMTLGFLLTYPLEAIDIEGKLIIKNDTMNVTFDIPLKFLSEEINYERLQNKVKYYDSTGTIITLRPDTAMEIQFTYAFENIRMLSRSNCLGLGSFFSYNPYMFLKVVIDGELKLFSYYETKSSTISGGGSAGAVPAVYMYEAEEYILQKGNDDLLIPLKLAFKSDMSEYLSDCPELVEKIKNKEFRKKDLKLIVEFYNSKCR